MDIGARLKEARVAKGLSLDSLQETTKIQKRYLSAIEEGNFHILPGKFYARAFIKEYANAVGLDPNELLEEHKEEIPKTEEEENVEYSRVERSRRGHKEKKSSALSSYFPTILTVLIVIGVLFAAWYFVQQIMSGDEAAPDNENGDNSEVIINSPDEEQGDEDAGNQENTEGEETEPEENDETGDQLEKTESELEVVEVGTGQSPESTLELNNAENNITILLESDGNTWLDITNEAGEAIYSSSFTAEESPKEIDVSGAEQLHFNIGNSTDLTISINGIEVEYPADQIHQKLTININ